MVLGVGSLFVRSRIEWNIGLLEHIEKVNFGRRLSA